MKEIISKYIQTNVFHAFLCNFERKINDPVFHDKITINTYKYFSP